MRMHPETGERNPAMQAPVLQDEVDVGLVTATWTTVAFDSVTVPVEHIVRDRRVRPVLYRHAVALPALMLVVMNKVVVDAQCLRIDRRIDSAFCVPHHDSRCAPAGDLIVIDLDVDGGGGEDGARVIVGVANTHFGPFDAQACDPDVVAVYREQRRGAHRAEKPRTGHTRSSSALEHDVIGYADLVHV